MQKVKVVYILGTGRTGSTILGIILGNLKGVFYAGELSAWNKFKGIPKSKNKKCLRFWEKIKQSITKSGKYYELDFHRYLEHHKAILRFYRLCNKQLLHKYNNHNYALFYQIMKDTHVTYIVDSSHYPLRAYLLNKNKYIDLRIIYLIRDPRQVVNSFQKKTVEQSSKNPFSANIYYFLVTILSSLVYFTVPKKHRIKIRYEDVISNPEQSLGRLSQFLNIAPEIENFDHLKTGCIFEGNRIRNQASIALRNQNSALMLNRFWWLFTTLVQFPFLLIHRYAINQNS